MFQCFVHVQLKNEVDLAEALFINQRRLSGQTIWPIQIKSGFLYLGVPNFFGSFYNALAIFSPKIK